MNEEVLRANSLWWFCAVTGALNLPMAISKDYVFLWRDGISAEGPSSAEAYRFEKIISAFEANDVMLPGAQIEYPVEFDDAMLAMNGMKTL